MRATPGALRHQFLDNTYWICFSQAQSSYIYGAKLAQSLATEIEARQEAGIAFNCGASCLLTFPKWRLGVSS